MFSNTYRFKLGITNSPRVTCVSNTCSLPYIARSIHLMILLLAGFCVLNVFLSLSGSL